MQRNVNDMTLRQVDPPSASTFCLTKKDINH